MSSRRDLNEAAINLTKLLTLITGLNDEQVDALVVEGEAYYLGRLRDETRNILRFATQAKKEGQHLK